MLVRGVTDSFLCFNNSGIIEGQPANPALLFLAFTRARGCIRRSHFSQLLREGCLLSYFFPPSQPLSCASLRTCAFAICSRKICKSLVYFWSSPCLLLSHPDPSRWRLAHTVATSRGTPTLSPHAPPPPHFFFCARLVHVWVCGWMHVRCEAVLLCVWQEVRRSLT